MHSCHIGETVELRDAMKTMSSEASEKLAALPLRHSSRFELRMARPCAILTRYSALRGGIIRCGIELPLKGLSETFARINQEF